MNLIASLEVAYQFPSIKHKAEAQRGTVCPLQKHVQTLANGTHFLFSSGIANPVSPSGLQMFTLSVSAQQEPSSGNSYYYKYHLFINEVRKVFSSFLSF